MQSVNLVIDEDPRTEITLSHVGEVFMAGQYRVSLPYSDGSSPTCRPYCSHADKLLLALLQLMEEEDNTWV